MEYRRCTRLSVYCELEDLKFDRLVVMDVGPRFVALAAFRAYRNNHGTKGEGGSPANRVRRTDPVFRLFSMGSRVVSTQREEKNVRTLKRRSQPLTQQIPIQSERRQREEWPERLSFLIRHKARSKKGSILLPCVVSPLSPVATDHLPFHFGLLTGRKGRLIYVVDQTQSILR